MIREIDCEKITQTVARLCIDANKILPPDIVCAVDCACGAETDALPIAIMQDIRDNIDCAKSLDIPVCQDTGMAVVFAEIGQDTHIVGGDFEDAVNRGVALGYTNGLLRKSVVADPLNRVNTNDNTPAVIHTKIVKGDKIICIAHFKNPLYSTTAVLWRVTWQPIFTATGNPAICVGKYSTLTFKAVVKPPKPCGPMPSALTRFNRSISIFL